VAWVTPLKRLLDLIEALGQLVGRFPELELRVAGGTPDQSYFDAVKARIAALGLERHVTFLGSLTPAQLLDEYRSCAILVHPSGQEHSPMAIAEAMAVGRPVVATNVGGVPDLVEHGRLASWSRLGLPMRWRGQSGRSLPTHTCASR
jgi:glycosyltransferase involved in cell wall biosynthesis